jgi:hypothetical protein
MLKVDSVYVALTIKILVLNMAPLQTLGLLVDLVHIFVLITSLSGFNVWLFTRFVPRYSVAYVQILGALGVSLIKVLACLRHLL